MSESLENFTNIVKEDIKEAKTLFFSEAFKEEYLKDRREEKELYHQLLLGRNRNQILEEFLLSSGQKKPVYAKSAATSSCSPLESRNSMQREASRMSLSAARLAGMPARPLPAAPGNISPRCVPLAAERRGFRSSLSLIVPSTAASVLLG